MHMAACVPLVCAPFSVQSDCNGITLINSEYSEIWHSRSVKPTQLIFACFQAYLTICDLMVVFCNQLFTNPNPLLGDLVYEADKALQTMLNEFIQNNVFVYQEEGRCAYYFHSLHYRQKDPQARKLYLVFKF